MSAFDEKRAAALEALLAEATPGPWRAVVEGGQPVCYYHALVAIAADPDGSGYVSVVQEDERTCRRDEWVPNAKAIAALRNDVPDLLAVWRAAEARADDLDAENERLRARCESMRCDQEALAGALSALRNLSDAAGAAHDAYFNGPGSARDRVAALGVAIERARSLVGGSTAPLRTAKTLPPEPGDDDPLVKALRALPKPHGRADWQERVLRGIDEEERSK